MQYLKVKTNNIGRKKRQGEKISGVVSVTKKGKTKKKKVSFRKAKSLPKGCKTAKRICIKCLKNSISKNEKNYDLKICKPCLNPTALRLVAHDLSIVEPIKTENL